MQAGLLVVYSSALDVYIILFILHVTLFLLSISVFEAHTNCAESVQLRVFMFTRIMLSMLVIKRNSTNMTGGCLENTDLESADHRPQTSKTQTSKTQT